MAADERRSPRAAAAVADVRERWRMGAEARGLVLVTDNVREFRRVPGLRTENWLRA